MRGKAPKMFHPEFESGNMAGRPKPINVAGISHPIRGPD